jgi:hypothetical protein
MEVSMAEWKKVVGYGLPLEVSADGRQVRLGKRVLKRFRLGQYFRVALPTRQEYVHTLVLYAYAGPRPLGKVADHIDGNAANNHPTNLRWVSRRENLFNGYRHGRFSGAKPKITVEQALEAIERYHILGHRVSDICLDLGIHFVTVHDILNGKTWGERIRARLRNEGEPKAPE